jgi:hypothetical protein
LQQKPAVSFKIAKVSISDLAVPPSLRSGDKIFYKSSKTAYNAA